MTINNKLLFRLTRQQNGGVDTFLSQLGLCRAYFKLQLLCGRDIVIEKWQICNGGWVTVLYRWGATWDRHVLAVSTATLNVIRVGTMRYWCLVANTDDVVQQDGTGARPVRTANYRTSVSEIYMMRCSHDSRCMFTACVAYTFGQRHKVHIGLIGPIPWGHSGPSVTRCRCRRRRCRGHRCAGGARQYR